jgi:hypothetical protein
MAEGPPPAEAQASPVYGWIVGTTITGSFGAANSQVESSTFAASPVEPDGSINTTTGDCWRSLNTYNGTFDTGNWFFQLAARAVTSATGQDGMAAFRLFRDTNADGSAATQITSQREVGTIVTNLLTSVTQLSNVTVNIPTFSVSGEYIFVQVGWEITGVATMANADVDIRIGSGTSQVLSANFTPAVVTGLGWGYANTGYWKYPGLWSTRTAPPKLFVPKRPAQRVNWIEKCYNRPHVALALPSYLGFDLYSKKIRQRLFPPPLLGARLWSNTS